MSHPVHRAAALTALALAVIAALPAAASTSILFVGNSYTFGRTDGSLNPDGTLNLTNQVLTYNASNVRDLTAPRGNGVLQAVSPTLNPPPYVYPGAPFTNVFGTNSYPIGMNIPGTSTQGNSYSPHTQLNTWGGTAGIFKKFTEQAGLNYDVALSTRNAASLRGHLLNTANTYSWDLRSNISSQKWDSMVLQEQSDEALGIRTTTTDFTGRPLGSTATLGSNYPSARAYVDLVEDWVHTGKVTIGLGLNQTAVTTFTDRDVFRAQYGTDAACQAAGGSNLCTNTTPRDLGVNANANPDTRIFLQQTWARPDLINPPGAKTLNAATALASYNTGTPAPSFYTSLEAMTVDMADAMVRIRDFADDDGSAGIAGIIPTGEAFLRAVQSGAATRDMYAPNALTDGRIDLWFNDGTHPSKWGSYLSALTVFGAVTGLDPASLGANEIAAAELGISQADALLLQRVASDQWLASAVPEPGTWAMMLAGLLFCGAAAARRAR